jgi:hypothetical protein
LLTHHTTRPALPTDDVFPVSVRLATSHACPCACHPLFHSRLQWKVDLCNLCSLLTRMSLRPTPTARTSGSPTARLTRCPRFGEPTTMTTMTAMTTMTVPRTYICYLCTRACVLTAHPTTVPRHMLGPLMFSGNVLCASHVITATDKPATGPTYAALSLCAV